MTIDDLLREFRHGALAAGLFVSLIAPGSLDAQGAGTISGTVTTAAATAASLRVSFDQRVCGSELPDETIVRGSSGQLANAVVTVVGVKARGGPPSVSVVNEKCRFVPRVQVARPQTTVTTTSIDPILHTTNAQREDGKLLFNVALPVPGITIVKTAGDTGIVRISCNTHPWMRGWMVVTDDVSAVTSSDGRFTLRDVPAGTYELRIWHESLGAASRRVSIAPGHTSVADFVLK